jgi:hypothetical protein
MCEYFSCIITRDFKILWLKSSPSHDNIIADAKLKDEKLVDRDFIRIEITPKNITALTRNRTDWLLKVDEENTLPKWFKDEKEKAKEACWIAWAESILINLVIDEESADVTDTYILIRDSSKVVARGSSTVEAWDSSKVVARDSSKVVARDSSTVEAWDSSTVVARDSSKVELKSAFSVALRDGKIYVHKDAKVIMTDGKVE